MAAPLRIRQSRTAPPPGRQCLVLARLLVVVVLMVNVVQSAPLAIRKPPVFQPGGYETRVTAVQWLLNGEGLYDDDAFVAYLDQSSLSHTVFGSQGAWMVEFYASWCGHCQTFAPTWKAVAKDLRGWRPLLTVAAINCADNANRDICLLNNIRSYPTIKLVPPRGTINDAEQIRGRSAAEFRDQAFKFLTKHSANFVLPPPKSWSQAKNILQTLDAGKKPAAIVWRADGRALETIFDLWALRDSVDVYALAVAEQSPADEVPPELKVDTVFVPGVNGNLKSLACGAKGGASCQLQLENYICDHFHLDRAWRRPEQTAGLVRRSSRAEYPSHPNIDDIYKAIEQAVHFEVPLAPELTGEALTSLKLFIKALKLYLPSGTATSAALDRLDSWAEAQRSPLSRADYLDFLDHWHLPNYEQLRWRQCIGSAPHFRGYPCGLWTTFHSLVERANRDSPAAGLAMLHTIKGFVQHFFGCKECAQHFLHMAENMEAAAAQLGRQGPPLWLWQAHNTANSRIGSDAEDRSTDPLYPKEQFPSAGQCRDCKFANNTWDLGAVATFLQEFYGTFEGMAELEHVPTVSNEGRDRDLVGRVRFQQAVIRADGSILAVARAGSPPHADGDGAEESSGGSILVYTGAMVLLAIMVSLAALILQGLRRSARLQPGKRSKIW